MKLYFSKFLKTLSLQDWKNKPHPRKAILGKLLKITLVLSIPFIE